MKPATALILVEIKEEKGTTVTIKLFAVLIAILATTLVAGNTPTFADGPNVKWQVKLDKKHPSQMIITIQFPVDPAGAYDDVKATIQYLDKKTKIIKQESFLVEGPKKQREFIHGQKLEVRRDVPKKTERVKGLRLDWKYMWDTSAAVPPPPPIPGSSPSSP